MNCPPAGMAHQQGVSDPELAAVLEFLRKRNLKAVESALLNEVKDSNNTTNQPNTANGSLDAFKSSGSDEPSVHHQSYKAFVYFIDTTLDVYKYELSLLLYPLFAHLYLHLIYNSHYTQAREFFIAFKSHQECYYEEYIRELGNISIKEQMLHNLHLDTFRCNKFVIRMSRECFMIMKRYLQDHKLTQLLNTIQDQLHIETYDGAPRNKEQVSATAGAMMGENRKDVNKIKVLYGLLKEPELQIPIEEDDDGEETDKPKKKKSKRDSAMMKKVKADPNAPNITRIPLPELRDLDKQDKIVQYKDQMKRVNLGPNNLPSVCLYTFLNQFQGVTCSTFSNDSTLLAAGFDNSTVKVWSLSSAKLRAMKDGDKLQDLPKEAGDILERMMDESTASDYKTLVGHNGPVFGVSISTDRQYLLSCSEDSTVRLWSLLTWTNLVCYKGHNYPVFDCEFSSHGYYFVSGGYDRLARVWSTDHFQPLRLLAGHFSTVDCVKMHPNCNYIATGSSDRTVRLYDVLNGNCVRTMVGHKSTILVLQFSTCGRFLASAGSDCNVHIWDLSNGVLLSKLTEHSNYIISLAFSRDGALLASGGLDNCIKLWDLSNISEELDAPDANTQQLPDLMKIPCISTLHTKSTPVLQLHFTGRNLLLAAGTYSEH